MKYIQGIIHGYIRISLFSMFSAYSQGTSSNSGKVSVLRFQEAGSPRDDAYALYPSSLPSLDAFTICYRLYAYFYRKEIVTVSYALDDKDVTTFRMDHTRHGFRMIVAGVLDVSKEVLPLRKWRHYCLAMDFASGYWSMAIQGHITTRCEQDSRLINRTIRGGGLLILGQDQDQLGGGFQADQSLSGSLTELQLWDYALDESTIADIANLQSDLQGNVIHWQESEWELYGAVDKSYVERSSFLIPYIRYVMLTTKRTFMESMQLCQSLQGKIATPKSLEETSQLYSHSASYYPLCKNNIGYIYIWIGYTDNEIEGVWKDSSTGLPIPYPGSWSPYEPNGEREENCAALHHNTKLWNDVACSRALMCSVCEFDHQVPVKVLGLCKRSGLDSHYLLAGEVNGLPFLAGAWTSRILWSNQHHAWVLESLWNNQTVGVMQTANGGDAPLPMGTHMWSFETQLCPGQPRTLELTVTSCGEGYYTCWEGSCVPLAQRCDRRINCPDRSDEENCNILGKTEGYRSEIPPSSHIEPFTALPVLVWVDILALTSINTIHMEFDVDFILKMAWYDKRLFFNDLKNEQDLNNLAKEEKNQVWTPAVSFKNARGNRHTVLDEEAMIHVLKMGLPLPPSSVLVHEVNMYSGDKAPLLLERKYHVRYGCAFSLSAYPFDTQSCVMVFESQFSTATHITLEPGHVGFLGRRQLVEYVVGDVTMERIIQNSSFSGVQVRLIFIRQSGYHLVATYLPTSIMIIISYLTFYFRVDDFTDRIMVSLTSLLVLSSLLTQTSETLPKTSYFKMIDIWLFFCIVTIFVVIIIHTASICVERENGDGFYLKREDSFEYESVNNAMYPGSQRRHSSRNSSSSKKDRNPRNESMRTTKRKSFQLTPAVVLTFGKIGVPFVVGVFNAIYWIIALVK